MDGILKLIKVKNWKHFVRRLVLKTLEGQYCWNHTLYIYMNNEKSKNI